MVAKKVTKKAATKTGVAKSVDANAPLKKIANAKAPAKRGASKKTVAGLKADQARLAEAHALLAKRKADGNPLRSEDIVIILRLLGEIVVDIHRIIVLLTSDNGPG